ncbi:hypothetical protein [Cellulomonas sp.]|uniref:hypothetical protein n=1 Tax=Cellulomonas sp. TaxID=40001 RepID=UPI00258ED737|nr:hypothetical protein [Cellulomonas sp.]MCR6688604.1 hypothetical protein [Cellulomonas sp.]
MAFHVDESTLESAATQLTTVARDQARATAYTDTHVNLHGGLGDSGIFVNAISVLDTVREAVDSSLARLRELTDASAAELRATATTYRETDDATDTRLDALQIPAPWVPGGGPR